MLAHRLIYILLIAIFVTNCSSSKKVIYHEPKSEGWSDAVKLHFKIRNKAMYYPTLYSKEDRQVAIKDWIHADKVFTQEFSNCTTMRLACEDILYLLSEHSRLGHNLDISGTEKKTTDFLELCFMAFPSSRKCHWTALRYYADTPSKNNRERISWSFLKNNATESEDEELAFYNFFIHMKYNKIPEAKIAAKEYVNKYPKGGWIAFAKALSAQNAKPKILIYKKEQQ